MSAPTITLCRTCKTADPTLPDQLSEALSGTEIQASLQQVDCMSGCKRPQTLAVRQSGKTAYLFGEISLDDIPDVLNFLRLYTESPDGNIADARPLGGLRFKAIARIPANTVPTPQ